MVFGSQGCKPLVTIPKNIKNGGAVALLSMAYRVCTVLHRHHRCGERINAIAPRFRIRGGGVYQGFAPLATQCHGSAVEDRAA